MRAPTRDDVLRFLASELRLDAAELDDDAPLFSSGLLDSYAMVTLTSFLEKSGGFTVQPTELTFEHFDTLGRLLRYVASKQTSTP